MALLLFRRSPLIDSAIGHAADLLGLAFGGLYLATKLEQWVAPFAASLFFVSVLAGYPVLTLRYLSGSLGQRLFGVEVVAWEGGRLSWKQCVLRPLGQGLELVLLACTGPIGMVLIWVYRGRHQRWWHETLSRTRVVRAGVPDPGPPPPRVPMPPDQKRLLLRVFGGLVGVLLVGAGAVVAARHYLGSGTLHVVAPAAQALPVSIDGGPPEALPPGAHRAFSLSRGSHRVALGEGGSSSTREVEVGGGWWSAVLGRAPAPCFVLLNVTDSHYRPPLADGTKVLPKIVLRLADDLNLLGWVHEPSFSVEELPETTSDERVELVAAVECGKLLLPDAQLLRDQLGFEGRSWDEINAGP